MDTLQKMPTFTKPMTLKFLRNTLGKPQKAICPILNVSQPTYSRMENEEKIYSPEEIEKIISSFGFKPEDLAKYEGTLFVVGNNFTHNKEVNYKRDENEEEKNFYKSIVEEMRQDYKDLKAMNERLLGMLEVKHHETYS
jgi:transcriptional regulator with XRE-family HTH domain